MLTPCTPVMVAIIGVWSHQWHAGICQKQSVHLRTFAMVIARKETTYSLLRGPGSGFVGGLGVATCFDFFLVVGMTPPFLFMIKVLPRPVHNN